MRMLKLNIVLSYVTVSTFTWLYLPKSSFLLTQRAKPTFNYWLPIVLYFFKN